MSYSWNFKAVTTKDQTPNLTVQVVNYDAGCTQSCEVSYSKGGSLIEKWDPETSSYGNIWIKREIPSHLNLKHSTTLPFTVCRWPCPDFLKQSEWLFSLAN